MSEGKVQESMYCPVSQSHEMTLESRDWQFGFWTSRFRDFCQVYEGFIFGEFGVRKKSQFRIRKNWPRKKVSASVSQNLVSEKSLGFGFGELGYKKRRWFSSYALNTTSANFCLFHKQSWPNLKTTFGFNVFGSAFAAQPRTVDEAVAGGW